MRNDRINRRRFLGASAATMAVAQFGLLACATAPTSLAHSSDQPAVKTGTHTSFGPLKQINAGLLNVGYAEAGKSDGPAVVLLHGWPYDIHSFVDVAPLLAEKGYRVIVPYLRGYGTTRFLSSETFRNGEPAVVALDLLALMDALKIERAILGAFDWGARTADIIAALYPQRCKALVSVSGYLIGSQASGKIPLPPAAECRGRAAGALAGGLPGHRPVPRPHRGRVPLLAAEDPRHRRPQPRAALLRHAPA
jgi:pimeloyl-ACP methyl ester carboxylesterase